jgi:drug/metabolite transporter (DMT)-like permease
MALPSQWNRIFLLALKGVSNTPFFLIMKHTETQAIIETAVAISLWAMSFVWIKIALAAMSPVTLIVLRYALGGVILLGVAFWRGEFKQMKRGDLKRMVILGFVGIFLQQFLQVSGQVSANANVAAFLASAAPAFMVILAVVWLREPVNSGQIFGVLLATLGAGIVAVGGNWRTLFQGELVNLGNMLVLFSAVVWAAYSVLTRKLVIDRPPMLIAGGMLFFGWLLSMPVWIFQQGWLEIPQISLNAWVALLCVGFFSTAITYLLYSHALKLASASRLSAIQNIEPLIATLAAFLILDEMITTSLLVGGCAILAGVYLAEKRSALTRITE